MFFILKKCIAMFFLPMSMVYGFFLSGTIILYRFKKKKGMNLIFAGYIALFFFSFNPLSSYVMHQLEQSFQPCKMKIDSIDYIAVLGGWAGYDTSLCATHRLSQSSLARLTEGIRLHRLYPNAVLVFSGNSFKQVKSMAEMSAEAAEEFGLTRKNMIVIPEPKDTEQEAIQIKKIIGEEKFFLVTSANHMKRAVMIFQAYSMRPIPAPTDFQIIKTSVPRPITYYMPSGQSIKLFEMIFHEYIGIIWFHLKSRLVQSFKKKERYER